MSMRWPWNSLWTPRVIWHQVRQPCLPCKSVVIGGRLVGVNHKENLVVSLFGSPIQWLWSPPNLETSRNLRQKGFIFTRIFTWLWLSFLMQFVHFSLSNWFHRYLLGLKVFKYAQRPLKTPFWTLNLKKSPIRHFPKPNSLFSIFLSLLCLPRNQCLFYHQIISENAKWVDNWLDSASLSARALSKW